MVCRRLNPISPIVIVFYKGEVIDFWQPTSDKDQDRTLNASRKHPYSSLQPGSTDLATRATTPHALLDEATDP